MACAATVPHNRTDTNNPAAANRTPRLIILCSPSRALLREARSVPPGWNEPRRPPTTHCHCMSSVFTHEAVSPFVTTAWRFVPIHARTSRRAAVTSSITVGPTATAPLPRHSDCTYITELRCALSIIAMFSRSCAAVLYRNRVRCVRVRTRNEELVTNRGSLYRAKLSYIPFMSQQFVSSVQTKTRVRTFNDQTPSELRGRARLVIREGINADQCSRRRKRSICS